MPRFRGAINSTRLSCRVPGGNVSANARRHAIGVEVVCALAKRTSDARGSALKRLEECLDGGEQIRIIIALSVEGCSSASKLGSPKRSTPAGRGGMASRDNDPPLAQFEDLTHTNADLRHMVLDGLQSIATAPTRRTRELRLVKVTQRRPVHRLDPDPEDGVVRVEVISLGPREVGGLEMHELRAEIVELAKPPHEVAVFTNAPEDATPERWTRHLPFNADLKTTRAEWTPRDGGSLVIAVALVG